MRDACLTPEKRDKPERMRAQCARERSIPVSDASWRSEELLQRPAQIGGLMSDRRRHEDGRIRKRDRRNTWCDGGRCTAGHPHHAAVHVVLLCGLVLIGAALVGAAIMLRLDGGSLKHRTGFSGHGR